mmetsp:Transcript_43143/g.67585  ORF Transcript_43143/g.67585 Transcript_43143/m.67585 type:complete len:201 (-) Transcript_43143:42-644(-)
MQGPAGREPNASLSASPSLLEFHFPFFGDASDFFVASRGFLVVAELFAGLFAGLLCLPSMDTTVLAGAALLALAFFPSVGLGPAEGFVGLPLAGCALPCPFEALALELLFAALFPSSVDLFSCPASAGSPRPASPSGGSGSGIGMPCIRQKLSKLISPVPSGSYSCMSSFSSASVSSIPVSSSAIFNSFASMLPLPSASN